MKPFRFSAHTTARDGKELAEVARRAEGLGYDALVFPDHLTDQLAPLPAMTAVAMATEKLRVAPFVLNVDLHHPAVLAQELASIDVLSGGRLDIAIGAGWNKPEYDAAGLSFDPTGVRVGRLAEAVAVLKGCFGDGEFSFEGRDFTITAHQARPKPLQKPHPPFLIGGGGRRTLELAAREADIIGLAPRLLKGRGDPRSMTWEATAEKIEWVKSAAGERFRDLELNAYPSGAPVILTDDLKGESRRIAQTLAEVSGVELTEQEVIDSPHIFVGSIDRLTEKFVELRERLGISSFMLGGVDDLAPVVERLAGT